MTNSIDEVGNRYSRLLVISEAKRKNGIYWNCICDCGNIAIVAGIALRYKNTQSCGCLFKETKNTLIDNRTKHELYATWRGMLSRCENPKATKYPLYGARGIKVCEEWHDFWIFVIDMGPKPKTDYTLNRINNNGNYHKDNCE